MKYILNPSAEIFSSWLIAVSKYFKNIQYCKQYIVLFHINSELRINDNHFDIEYVITWMS